MSYKRIIIGLAILFVTYIFIRIIRIVLKSHFLYKISNVLVYLIELYFAGTLISLLLYQGSFQSHTSFFMIFKDYVFANSIYQIILNIILKFWDGTTIDGYNSLQTATKEFKLYSSDKDKLAEFLVTFQEKINKLDKERAYDKYSINVANNLIDAVDTYLNTDEPEANFNRYIDEHMIDLEHRKSITSLGWQNSLLLRILK